MRKGDCSEEAGPRAHSMGMPSLPSKESATALKQWQHLACVHQVHAAARACVQAVSILCMRQHGRHRHWPLCRGQACGSDEAPGPEVVQAHNAVLGANTCCTVLSFPHAVPSKHACTCRFACPTPPCPTRGLFHPGRCSKAPLTRAPSSGIQAGSPDLKWPSEVLGHV